MGFLARTVITAFAFWCADMLLDGIAFSGPFALFFAAIIFGLVNGFIRPVLALLSLPITIITLGFFVLVINAAMLGLTALLIPGMTVAGFGSAFFGAIIVSIVSWLVNRTID
ncbi:phage holin family protein [Rhodovarius crocodyli]|uniref:Phage holin family protein n=1 Tax=Rhodovarius crocodyli TaxID=1979269 RepID=A0A437M339_9PROT|nr:phage holin family protein [Rhodovarius crocodyli]RVT91944.1 phage holin family protein [Rhodovarius crocodyli]